MNITKFLRDSYNYLFVDKHIYFIFRRYTYTNSPGSYAIVFISAIVASLYLSLALVSTEDIGLSLFFFALSVFFCVIVLSEFIHPLIKKIDQLQIDLCKVNEKLDDIEKDTEQAIERIESLEGIKQRPGFVYIMKRDDGIIKIGRSVNTETRLKQHESDYNCKFAIIETFVVPDTITFEYLALSMTAHCSFLEPHRNELRSMSNQEIDKFRTVFTAICKEAVVLR